MTNPMTEVLNNGTERHIVVMCDREIVIDYEYKQEDGTWELFCQKMLWADEVEAAYRLLHPEVSAQEKP